MTAPLVLLSDLNGLRVSLVRSQETFTPPSWVSEHPVYRSTVQAFEILCQNKQAFDGAVWVPTAVDLQGSEVTVYCAETVYSVARGLDAVNARTPSAHGLLDLRAAPTGMVGVDTAVLTSDNQVLVGSRSPRAGKWPGAWFIGFGEGIGPGDEGAMAAAAIRCLKEELNLTDLCDDAAARVAVRAFAREESHISWTGYAVADFRGLGDEFSASRLLQAAASASDAWEVQRLSAVPVAELAGFLTDKEVVPASAVLSATIQRLVLPR